MGLVPTNCLVDPPQLSMLSITNTTIIIEDTLSVPKTTYAMTDDSRATFAACSIFSKTHN